MVTRRLALLALLLPACTDQIGITDNDLAEAPDLTQAADLAMAPDLRSPPDLSVPSSDDLSTLDDLSAPVELPDLTPLDDLTPIDDLTPPLSVPPVVTQATPSNVALGASLVVTGTALGGATVVTIGGVAQTFNSNTSTSLTIPAVAGGTPLGTQAIVVTTPSGISASFNVTIVAALAINNVAASSATTVVVTFNRAVDDTTVVTADFNIVGLAISGVAVAGANVTLTTASQTPAQSYNLEFIGSINDTFGNPATNGTFPFTGFGVPPPVVTQAAPTNVALGATLVVTGTSLGGATAVTIGGIAQTFNNSTSTSLTIPAVAGGTPLGTQAIVVTTPSGTSAGFNVTVVDALAISTVAATSATTVVVTFNRAVDNATVVKADFNITALTISGVAVAGANVTLTTASQTPAQSYNLDFIGSISDTFGNPATNGTFPFNGFGVPPPVVTQAAPTNVALGATLVVTGTSLGAATAVTIGGIDQTFNSNTSTSLTIPAVAGGTPLGTQAIVVTTPSGTSAGFNVTVVDALTISTVAASSATTVVVTFNRAVDDATVVEADFNITGLPIVGIAVAGANVTLTTASQTPAQSYNLDFIGSINDTFGNPATSGVSIPFNGFGVPPPVITQLTPITVVRGISSLTIDGTGMDNATAVTIGGTLQAIDSNTATQIVVNVVDAATPTGMQQVIVTNPNGSSVGVDVEVLDRLKIASATAPNQWTVQVTFNRAVDDATIAAARFAIPGLTILAASSSGAVVTLTTSGQTGGTTYTVSADNQVLDTLGTPADGTTADFTGSYPTEFVVARVGTPQSEGGAALTASPAPVVLQRRLLTTGALVASPSPLPLSKGGTVLTLPGTTSADGALTRSPDGKFLSMYGYNLAPGAAFPGPRVVAVADWNDFNDPSGLDLTTFTGNGSPSSASTIPRGAVINGSNIWLASGASNIQVTTLGSSSAPTTIATQTSPGRVIRIFDGDLYITMSGLLQRVPGLPTSTPSVAATTIVPSNGPYSFTFFDMDSSEPGVDLLYIVDESTAANGGGFRRYRKTAGTWGTTPEAILGPSGVRHGTCWLVAHDPADPGPDPARPSVDCIAVGGLSSSNFIKLHDIGGSGSAPGTTLAGTAPPTFTAYRGLDLAPVP